MADKVDEIVALLKVNPNQETLNTEERQFIIPQRPAQTVESTSLSPPSLTDSHGLTVDIDEADGLLAHFRQQQATLAPYVVIPETTTASQLRDEKPLLFLAIITAASHHDAQRQEHFSKAAMALLADHILIQGQKNLALLQGMLLLLSWFHTQSLVNAQITNLSHLSMAMTVDLALNQPPLPVLEPHRGPTLLDGPRRAIHGTTFHTQVRSLDGRRAYAGCYYLSNVVATSFVISLPTALPWSAQLDEACDELTRTGSTGDLRLATLIKLQHIMSQISEMKADIVSSGRGAVMPLSVYISPFEAALTKLWDSTPKEVQQDSKFDLRPDGTLPYPQRQTTNTCPPQACLHIAYHTARMHLYQLSLPPTLPSSSPHPPPESTPARLVSISTTRSLCLHSALAAMDVHLSLPAAELYHMPLPFYATTGHALTTLARLRAISSSSSSSDLDTDPLFFDLARLLERTAAHLEEAGGCGHWPVRSGVSDEATAAARGRKRGDGGRMNDRLLHWAAWLRRCARALGVADQGRTDGGGVAPAAETCRGDGVGAGGSATDAGGDGVAGQDGRAKEMPGGRVAVDDYLTPLSGVDVDGGTGGVTGFQEHDSFPMEWTAALLEDISGYGLFGLSDEFLMQDIFAGGAGGGDAG